MLPPTVLFNVLADPIGDLSKADGVFIPFDFGTSLAVDDPLTGGFPPVSGFTTGGVFAVIGCLTVLVATGATGPGLLAIYGCFGLPVVVFKVEDFPIGGFETLDTGAGTVVPVFFT